MRAVKAWAAVAAWSLMIFAGGCGDNPKDMQIQHLQDKVDDLTRQRDELRSRLDTALNDANQMRAELARLQQELDKARSELASIPRLPEGWEQAGGVAWTNIAEDILFDSGKADLKPAGRTKLQQVVQQIRSTPELANRNLWVVGHTDTDPIKYSRWKDNLELSVQRGATVARELYKLGIDPRYVTAGGQGEHNPIAPNDTRANKQKNRRVQIIAVARPPTEGTRTTPPAEARTGPARQAADEQPQRRPGVQPVEVMEPE